MAKSPRSSSERKLERIDPDRQVISDIQTVRLAEATGLSVKELAGKTLGDLHKSLRLHLDPHLLLHRRICGRVVKRNPETGDLEGVPNATVHVEDTDCSFMIYSPPGWPHWSWFLPFKCKREVLATTVTDECGRFCVWVPAWEIDWIIRWRRARLCFPTLWRPRLKDWLERIIIPELEREPPRIKPPVPPVERFVGQPSRAATPIEIPRPKPDDFLAERSAANFSTYLKRPDVQERLVEVAGEKVVGNLSLLAEATSFGTSSERIEAELDSPVIPLPPPLPRKMERKALRNEIGAELAEELGDDIRVLRRRRWIGPFWRCTDIWLGIWTRVFDVPDITFRVTQDTDADGTEETIYSEGFFDVRWNAGAMGDVVLEADAIALSTPHCDGPEIDPGICEAPAIVTAGLMPLQGPHFDTSSGYGKTINRARSGGMSTSARDRETEAPLCHTVQLHGCHRFPGADFYRILKRYEGATNFTPILGETWVAPQLSGPPLLISPDANGWYPVQPAANLVFPHWLLNWRTWRYADGRYELKLEMGDAGKNPHSDSAVVPIEIDNSDPAVTFTELAWRYPGGGWTVLPASCPVVRRIAGRDVEIRATVQVSAKHFRNATLFGRGCAFNTLPKIDLPADYDHWHTTAADNAWSTSGRFLVDAALDDGAYTIGVNAYGRTFNPAGGDSGPSSGWDYDPIYSWTHPRRHIAIVDL